MDSNRRARLSPALVVAILALAAALAGTAVAGSGPTAESAGTAAKALKTAKKALRVAKRAQKQQGPTGPQGPAGTARAYAHVPGGATCQPGGCEFDLAKGVTAVTRVGTGFYCVTVPGVSSASVPAAVTVDWGRTEHPEGNASAMVVAGDVSCGDGFAVQTERHSDSAGTDASPASDVAFTIVVP